MKPLIHQYSWKLFCQHYRSNFYLRSHQDLYMLSIQFLHIEDLSCVRKLDHHSLYKYIECYSDTSFAIFYLHLRIICGNNEFISHLKALRFLYSIKSNFNWSHSSKHFYHHFNSFMFIINVSNFTFFVSKTTI